MPPAASTSRIMWLLIAYSLESFEDTTTAARTGTDTASASTMAAQSVFRKEPTGVRTAWYTLSVGAGRVKLTVPDEYIAAASRTPFDCRPGAEWPLLGLAPAAREPHRPP